MIVIALADLIYTLLDLLLVFNLPSLPDSISSVLSTGLDHVVGGVGMLGAFLGPTTLGILAVLLRLVLLMHGAYLLYTFVRFILRKIPMLGIDM